MSIPPVVALEIGTSKVVALVGELRDDGSIMITGIGEHPATGVRKAEVIDVGNAAICVRSALAAAEESGRVSIRRVHLAVSGAHIQTVINRGAVPVIDKAGEISGEDIDQVMEVARALNLPPDRDILHTICQHFCIDEQQRVIQPEGMDGARLSLDMLVIHGVRNRIRNAVKVVRSLSVDVHDVVFSGLCSALSVLTPEQKKSGAIVIDMGGVVTEYLAYADNIVAAAGVLGVGGDHVTNDIGMGFNIPNSRAESLKRRSGSAFVRASTDTPNVDVPAEGGFAGRSVDLHSLDTVINARVDETLGMIKKRLAEAGLLHHIGAGVILTGGGACLRGIKEVVESIFHLPCSMGKPSGITGLAVAAERPEYSTCSGLVKYGFKMNDERRPGSLGNWLRGLFGGRQGERR